MSPCPRRVLIAEDDPVIARVLARNLEREGLSTQIAFTGEEALAALPANAFDFLMVDYQLPDMTGEMLCRQVRQNPCYRYLPMAMCTAKAHEVDTAALIVEFGLVAVFPKPFSLQEIVAAIVSAVPALASTPPARS
jgi:CheY-like chemotaxis protein